MINMWTNYGDTMLYTVSVKETTARQLAKSEKRTNSVSTFV